jgi:hypothetical protein
MIDFQLSLQAYNLQERNFPEAGLAFFFHYDKFVWFYLWEFHYTAARSAVDR